MYVEAAAIRLSTLELDRAFEVSVLPERGRLFALALVITRDRSAAEDAVQETLLAAWKAWPTVSDPYRPGGWLTRICVNQCIRRRRRFSPPVALDDASIADVTARRQIELGGDLVDFDRAFGLLTARQRAVFTLHVRHGYTVTECAELVGCRPGTARSHLARAVATLRKEMERA
ncbi:MAG TPA: RNA polymerase sigma factor [Candidatus Dormibacteraeota bacterium]